MPSRESDKFNAKVSWIAKYSGYTILSNYPIPGSQCVSSNGQDSLQWIVVEPRNQSTQVNSV